MRQLARALMLVALMLAPIAARADTVASLLGNFTINQFSRLRLSANVINVHYVVVFGQLPALRELHLADADADGVTTQIERDAYVAKLAPSFAEGLKVTVDGVRVPLAATHWTTSLPTEQGGFSLRLDVDFSGALAVVGSRDPQKLEFANQNYTGRFGWQEIVVEASKPMQVFATDAFSTSLTNGLTEAVQEMPAAGPLSERAVHLSMTSGAVPPGAQTLPPRPGTALVASQSASVSIPGVDGSWLKRETRRLVDLISAPTVEPHIALLALLAAILLGALHAFSPGHGKAVVGAYLIGSRSTPRHAVFLGATVTITHTLGVFVLGFATLVASKFIVPEQLFPILSLVSGLLVLGMGLVLLVQRWRGARDALGKSSGQAKDLRSAARSASRALSGFRRVTRNTNMGGSLSSLVLAHPHVAHANTLHNHDPHHHDHHHGGHAHGAQHYHDSHEHGTPLHHSHAHSAQHHHENDGHGSPHHHDNHLHGTNHHHAHDHQREHATEHAHDDGLMHSHGGSVHSHLPPGAKGDQVTWRSLLALGISGGLVPCPSAMVLLLAAVALNKTAYGLVLVVAFSLGLAMTLVAVGLVFLYARSRLHRPSGTPRWAQLLPVMSAGAITLLGAFLCYGAVTGMVF